MNRHETKCLIKNNKKIPIFIIIRDMMFISPWFTSFSLRQCRNTEEAEKAVYKYHDVKKIKLYGLECRLIDSSASLLHLLIKKHGLGF
jgi:hypothetical protein